LQSCRAATIINPLRPSKYIPDRQRFPIQIVALHLAFAATIKDMKGLLHNA